MNTLIYHLKNNLKYLLLLCAPLLIAACQSSAPPEQEEKEQSHEDGIELSSVQMKAVGITLGKIELKNLKSVVKANGQLEVPPQNKAEVHPLVDGVVKKILVLEGNYVRKGQTLVVLENPEFIKVQQDYLTSRSALSFASKEYERQKELMAAKAGTGKVFQKAESDYFAEQSRFQTLSRQLKQIGVNIRSLNNGAIITEVAIPSPINGVVGHIRVTTGSYAGISEPLMSITDNSSIHCDLLVYEKDLFKVKPGQEVDFILTNQNNQQISGKIYGINKNFENETKAVVAHSRIDNSANRNLIPGMYVSALINVGTSTTTAVPEDAVIIAQSKSYIFMVSNSHIEKEAGPDTAEEAGRDEKRTYYTFKAVEVATGVSELGYIEITPLSKVPKDALIVTKGAFYIQSKTAGSGEEH